MELLFVTPVGGAKIFMGTQFLDPEYIVRLIRASRLLSEQDKDRLETLLPKATRLQLLELQSLLEQEQGIHVQYFRDMTEVEKEAAERAVRNRKRIANSNSPKTRRNRIRLLDRRNPIPPSDADLS